MDSIQAIFLKEKLKHLGKWNKSRLLVASYYNDNIKSQKVKKPKVADYCKLHTYHIYCLQVDDRDVFMKYLQENDIQCGIHYPIPIELTKPYSDYGERFDNKTSRDVAQKLVSLPMHPFMSQNDMQKVCEVINAW